MSNRFTRTFLGSRCKKCFPRPNRKIPVLKHFPQVIDKQVALDFRNPPAFLVLGGAKIDVIEAETQMREKFFPVEPTDRRNPQKDPTRINWGNLRFMADHDQTMAFRSGAMNELDKTWIKISLLNM